ncbi:FtsK/SpoIIIE domain-containing protein [Oerskovia sp. M15]
MVLEPDVPIGEAWLGSGRSCTSSTPREPQDRRRTSRTSWPASGSWPGRTPDCSGTCSRALRGGAGTGLRHRAVRPLVSKKHARLDASDRTEVVDLGSANGIVVDGGPVTRLRVDRQQSVVLGDTVLVIEPLGSAAGGPVAGPVPFNRSPRSSRATRARSSRRRHPAGGGPAELPVLALIAPVVLGLTMFFFTKRPTALLFILMSPMMLIGNYVTERKRRRRRRERDLKRFDERLEGLRTALRDEEAAERSARLQEAPATPLTLAEGLRRGPLLWTRRPEHWSFLNVRLGLGSMPSRNEVEVPGRGEMLPEFQERLDELLDKHERVAGVPVVENLHDAGALGLAGQQNLVEPVLNSVLVQLTVLHSPADLVVCSLVTPTWSRSLEWLKWMPHTSASTSPIDGNHLADSASSGGVLLAQLEELIRARLADKRERQRRRGRQAAGTRLSSVARASERRGRCRRRDELAAPRGRGPRLGRGGRRPGSSGAARRERARRRVFPVWVADSVRGLPAACRTYVEVEHDGASVGMVRLGLKVDDVVLEMVDPSSAVEYGRRMAPVFDAGVVDEDASDLPRTVSLLTLLGSDMAASSEAVIDRWNQNLSITDRTPGAVPRRRRAGGLRALVGSAGSDAMQLDLRTHGPHALVGGTTGSGKSEFLQAWVLGMAAEYSPDRVTFLFVDYKGGSAFADCVQLPHCVGLVTDLSQHLVRRALTSLRAELHHREHLFNRKKAKDILELEKRGDPDTPPALVIVIDEFAALVSDVPDFVDGVVDIAQRGRSLGIHLIMATQRPAGVIRDNLRANTNLRVALRMADESDSSDVVGSADAAHFDPGLPGAASRRRGPAGCGRSSPRTREAGRRTRRSRCASRSPRSGSAVRSSGTRRSLPWCPRRRTWAPTTSSASWRASEPRASVRRSRTRAARGSTSSPPPTTSRACASARTPSS